MSTPFTLLDNKYGLPKGFLASVWFQESSCGRDTYNEKSGCEGHFQFKKATRDEILRESGHDAFSADPTEAAHAAGFYYQKLQRHYGGNIRKALAAYNWGMGRLASFGMSNAPEETRNYITEILSRVTSDTGTSYPTPTASTAAVTPPTASTGPTPEEREEEERRRRLRSDQPIPGTRSANASSVDDAASPSGSGAALMMFALLLSVVGKAMESNGATVQQAVSVTPAEPLAAPATPVIATAPAAAAANPMQRLAVAASVA